MTSEILLMNAKCVVLAADSAVTVGDKIYRADKIFKLSRRQPIAVMSYGNADISGMPLELLVNEYRSRLGDRTFPTVEECTADFLGFLEKGGADDFRENPFITRGHIDREVRRMTHSFWKDVTDETFRELVSRVYGGMDRTEGSVGELFRTLRGDFEEVLERHLANISKGVDRSRAATMLQGVEGALNGQFIEETDSVDPHLKFSDHQVVVSEIIANTLASGRNPDYTGMVIAGYGSEEYAPSYHEHFVYGLSYDGLNSMEKNRVSIGIDNPSWISPFAQDDVVRSFIYGIDDNMYLKTVEDLREMLSHSADTIIKLTGATDKTEMVKKLNVELVEKYKKDILYYTYNHYKCPIESAVEFLSKDEMALMAESMINFMSLKKRVSNEAETVRGPVDVAVISRNEGLVWVKRKHFFNMELNPNYKRC
ncbi:MAG: hypothetical protein FWH47_00270 [Methanomassiliicoccaceae archaeon]|nr:hypothetical protein [Methanomassiliicoccaceae archaeon]